MQTPLDRYIELRDFNESLLKNLKKRGTNLSYLRLIVFIFIIFTSIKFINYWPIFIYIIVLVLMISVFGLLLILDLKNRKTKSFVETKIEIYKSEIRLLNLDFSNQITEIEHIDPHHPYSHDLDLFGEKSIFQYIARTGTSFGKQLLAYWFKHPFVTKEKISDQQIMIKELSENAVFREEFYANCILINDLGLNFIEFENWLKDSNLLVKSMFTKLIRIISPLISILIIALVILGNLDPTILSLPIVLNFAILSFYLKRINSNHRMLSKSGDILYAFADAIRWIENTSFSAQGLRNIQSEFGEGKTIASEIIKKLGRILNAFDGRLNLLLNFLGNGFFLMDIQSEIRLENWKDSYRHRVVTIFKNIANFEALNSLAFFAFNHPEFCYPSISEKEIALKATNLGHPLIDKDQRIGNNFDLKHHHITIITGANMAGKSTFLRTLGINFVLANLGSVVCASSFQFMPGSLFTSMRTTDSLTEKESYFFAELKRLKYLLDELGDHTLFLLDEILKGTNSEDKQQGSWKFTEKLLKLKATGIIATHDLHLTRIEDEFPDLISNQRFEVDIMDDQVQFDYKLQDGATKKMNAQLLMRNLGLIE